VTTCALNGGGVGCRGSGSDGESGSKPPDCRDRRSVAPLFARAYDSQSQLGEKYRVKRVNTDRTKKKSGEGGAGRCRWDPRGPRNLSDEHHVNKPVPKRRSPDVHDQDVEHGRLV